jgi:hypothetical protein
MFNDLRWVRVILLAALLSSSVVRSVQAAASITLELSSHNPVAGQAVELTVRTWATADERGSPELSTPIDMTGYPFDIRAYRAAEFHGRASAQLGFPIALKQRDAYTWRAEVTFPEADTWVIVWRNVYPPLALQMPAPDSSSKLEVQVLPASAMDKRDDARWRIVLIALLVASIIQVIRSVQRVTVCAAH